MRRGLYLVTPDLLDTDALLAAVATVLPSRGVELPASLEDGGSARARAKGLEIDIDGADAGATRLRARIADASFDVVAELPPGHERLAVVVGCGWQRFHPSNRETRACIRSQPECSSRYFWASSAAMQPLPALVTACR